MYIFNRLDVGDIEDYEAGRQLHQGNISYYVTLSFRKSALLKGYSVKNKGKGYSCFLYYNSCLCV